jgi:hypothetical protein
MGIKIIGCLLLLAGIPVMAQIRVAGSGNERGKFVVAADGCYFLASEVENKENNEEKFLVFSKICNTNIRSVMVYGRAPLAINNFIMNSHGELLALGERYLENGRESMLLIQFDKNLEILHANVFNENGNELEPYDITEHAGDYYITGFTKTGEVISNGIGYFTQETQHFYLGRYSCELEKEESFLITGFGEGNAPTGKVIASDGSYIYIAGNVIGEKRSAVVLLRFNPETNKVDWANEYRIPKDVGVTDITIKQGEIALLLTITEKDNSDAGLLLVNMSGEVKGAYFMPEEGYQRAHRMELASEGALLIHGTSGINQFMTQRSVTRLDLSDGNYRLRLEGSGQSNEAGGMFRDGEKFVYTGYEFASKRGYDTVLRFSDRLIADGKSGKTNRLEAVKVSISVSAQKFPKSKPLFESELFKEKIRYQPSDYLKIE